jgi:hypothetical protein
VRTLTDQREITLWIRQLQSAAEVVRAL